MYVLNVNVIFILLTFTIIIINFQLLAMPIGKWAQWEPTWQEERVHSGNLGRQKRDRHTDTHTLHHYIYINSLAGGRQNKQKRDKHTDRHTLHHYIYINSLAGEGKISKNVTNKHTDIHFIIIYISTAWQGEGKISKNVTNIHFIIIYIYQQLGRGKAK